MPLIIGLLIVLFRFVVNENTISWPSGTYGLYTLRSNCPINDSIDWKNGIIKIPVPQFSYSWNMKNYSANKAAYQLKFCMKITSDASIPNLNWPLGKYCIFKKGECPFMMKKGSVYIDNWKTTSNQSEGHILTENKYSGEIPSGSFKKQSFSIEFCCSIDGSKQNPIRLPSSIQSLSLLNYEDDQCQTIESMKAEKTSLFIDVEDRLSEKHIEGYVPYGSHSKDQFDVNISLCVYSFDTKHVPNDLNDMNTNETSYSVLKTPNNMKYLVSIIQNKYMIAAE